MQGCHLKPRLIKAIIDAVPQGAPGPVVRRAGRCQRVILTGGGLWQPLPKPVGSLVPAHCPLQSHEGQDGEVALPSKAKEISAVRTEAFLRAAGQQTPEILARTLHPLFSSGTVARMVKSIHHPSHLPSRKRCRFQHRQPKKKRVHFGTPAVRRTRPRPTLPRRSTGSYQRCSPNAKPLIFRLIEENASYGYDS